MIDALGYFKDDGCLEMDDSAASQYYNTTLYFVAGETVPKSLPAHSTLARGYHQ
jgi:hypothetical protein